MPTLRNWLADAPFALGMSSGFFGFFAHAGMLSVLEEEGLIPERLSGSSAGALVGGCWAAGMNATDIGAEFLELEKDDFWDPKPGLGLLKGDLFRKRLEELLPVSRFEQCRKPLTLSVYDVIRRTTEVRSEGELAPAISASCAVPFMFHPVWLENESRRLKSRPYLDGGITDRPGLEGVPQGTRILYHHLASRSPWRRKNTPALRIPQRDGLTALVIQNLPRSGPNKLPAGRDAFAAAQKATKEALDLPITTGVVELSA